MPSRGTKHTQHECLNQISPSITQQKTPSIDGIKWRVKGGGSADPSDTFAFDFTSDRDGKVSKDKAPIIDYVKQNGPFQARALLGLWT